MATYYDGLNYTYKAFEKDPPPASAQLVMLHLGHENNRHGNTGTFQLSDRELAYRTRLSKTSITEAKRILKNRGFIDFKTDRDSPAKVTSYKILFFSEKVGQEAGQRIGQTPGQTVGQNALFPIPTHAEDLRPKTKDSLLVSARARGTQELDEVLEYWEETLNGGRLTVEHQSELLVWLKRYGMDCVKSAMKEASDANGSRYGLNFRLLRGVMERKINPTLSPKAKGKEMKGVIKNGRAPECKEYELPDTSDDVDWRASLRELNKGQ